jgi:tetratricopeptide (TPR) repeat protein
MAQWWAGRTADADATLAEALMRAERSRDRRMQLRARLELDHFRLFTDRQADPAQLIELAREGTLVFEEVGDERALGRAWKVLGYVRGSMEGRCGDWLDAAERAVIYYRRSGWSPAGCLLELATALFYGPTPVPEGIARCETLFEEASDRVGTAHVLVYLGALHALAGRPDEGHAMLAEAQSVYRELGDAYSLAANSGRAEGRVRLLTGDVEEAEQAFRVSCETLGRLHDEPGLSSVAAELGRALHAQGHHAEAIDWVGIAEEHAPSGDIVAQFSWRSLKGKLLADEGRLAEGEALALEALEIVERTDLLTHHGDVLLDLAHVLCAAQRHVEAATRIERAVELFALKGNIASERSARSLLDEVAVG